MRLEHIGSLGGLLLAPVLDCPADLVKTMSVHTRFDGGKWLCGLGLLGRGAPPTSDTRGPRAPACLIYSFGSNFDISFESYIADRVKRDSGGRVVCTVHIIDPTLHRYGNVRLRGFRDELRRRATWHLHEVALAGADNVRNISISLNLGRHKLGAAGVETVTYPAASLRELLASNGHDKASSGACVDVLKIDVEGAEAGVLANTPWPRLCIGMLLFELHVGTIEAHERKPFSVGRAVGMIKQLEAAGFAHYSSEPVCERCHAIEFGFVNTSWLRTRMLLGTRKNMPSTARGGPSPVRETSTPETTTPMREATRRRRKRAPLLSAESAAPSMAPGAEVVAPPAEQADEAEGAAGSVMPKDSAWDPWPRESDAYSVQQEAFANARLVTHDSIVPA